MKSAIFSALVWGSGSAVLGTRAVALSNSGHLFRTLRGWAVAALLISLALHFFHGEKPAVEESLGRQAGAAFAAFALFSVLLVALIAAVAGSPVPWLGTLLTFVGGGLAPVVAVMALEFPDLRRRALAAGAVAAAGLVSLTLVNTLTVKPAPAPHVVGAARPERV
jgi:hypothetical protein